MDKGSCWKCKHLSVIKDEDEIFWHYRCLKNPSKGEMDPSGFVYYERCFEPKIMEFDSPADVNIDLDGMMKDKDRYISTILKYSN